ncbi:MAG: TlpA family protein disulfide reductase [Elusimicrobia bacterium]|nr:TlpA family protein disulfide reductase [Elusimicrobiota bacterium]
MERVPKPLEGWKAAAVIAAIAGLVFLTTRVPTSHQELGTSAPALSLPDLSGKPVSLSDFKGKVVLLDFWATWCGPCQEELPDLIALHEKYKAKGFTMLGVSEDSAGRDAVAEFAALNKIPYPILLSGGKDPAGWDVPGLPTAFLIDRKGRVARSYIGPRSGREFARDIESVLGD